MIHHNEVFLIGHITRTHGTHGEVELQFTDDPFERGVAQYLVLEIDGILVPFFYSQWRYKGQHSALFIFEDISDESHAKQLVGRTVYYPFSSIPRTETDEALSSIRALTGFTITGIGQITNVDDSSQNILLTVIRKNGEELLIPYHDDFLISYDLYNRTIDLQLPEGLLSL